MSGVSTGCGFANLQGSNECEPGTAEEQFGRNTIEVISGAELAEKEGNLKMVRLVGDCLMHPNQGDAEMATMRMEGTLVQFGLIVVDADMSSGAEEIPWVDPADRENADRSWLWLRNDWCRPYDERYGYDGGIGMHKAHDSVQRFDIDIGVSRRLRADQRLVMMVRATNTGILTEDLGNAEPVSLALNLRAYILH